MKAFISDNTGTVVFLKLYLITKEQVLDILKTQYGLELEESVNESIFQDLTKPGMDNK